MRSAPGLYVQVVAVGEDQFGTGRLDLLGREPFQRRVGADGGKARRLKRAVRRVVPATAQLAVLAEEFEAKGGHGMH